MNTTGTSSLRQILTTRNAIIVLLIAHVIALPLFPPESFVVDSQEWWLPVLLMILIIVADVELIARHSDKEWPWYLISFGNGFNILSRLMMVWSHATYAAEGSNAPNYLYIVLTIISIAISTFMLVYTEWPEVRVRLLKTVSKPSKA
ncbi:MAG: hypothetical protein M1434_11965 [Chloroflexi bacterium]|nr:hypothetical protein [Chloroflexota bacterium]MCL5275439.1 hypothetical protein [Chloroflexota bacterium]